MNQPAPGLAERIHGLSLWTGRVEIAPLAGGLSNQSFKVRDAGECYVVRLGEDLPHHHVARDRELMITRAAGDAGFAPALVHAEPGLMVSRFVDGVTLDATGVRERITPIADLLRDFHRQMPALVHGPAFMFWPFHVIREYLRTLRAGSPGASSAELTEFLTLAEELESVQQPLPIVFGHHDCLPANFIDDGQRLWLIDFEYAGFSTAMFDLAGVASNADFTAGQSDELLNRYFDGEAGSALRHSHDAMQCASLLRETLWSMVSERFMSATGVDYAAYTSQNRDSLKRAIDSYRSHWS
jgi:thiamine kinase-like enzyme